MKQNNKRETGGAYERLAGEYLEKQGLCILEKNYRCSLGEIDLIARDGEYLVFVEVKYRTSFHQGYPVSAVNRNKQKKISRVARYYLLREVHSCEVPCRFDVVGIDRNGIHWIRNAFEEIV